jgi:hypothetical protein
MVCRAAGAELRGLLVFGHEVRSLQPCGDTRIFWVQAPTALRQRLPSRLQQTEPTSGRWVTNRGGTWRSMR